MVQKRERVSGTVVEDGHMAVGSEGLERKIAAGSGAIQAKERES